MTYTDAHTLGSKAVDIAYKTNAWGGVFYEQRANACKAAHRMARKNGEKLGRFQSFYHHRHICGKVARVEGSNRVYVVFVPGVGVELAAVEVPE